MGQSKGICSKTVYSRFAIPIIKNRLQHLGKTVFKYVQPKSFTRFIEYTPFRYVTDLY